VFTRPPSLASCPARPPLPDALNERQRAAVEHRGAPLLVVAGAGTGKTKTLAARVAALLDDGVAPERILLLTFSRRAAAEMLARASASGSSRAAARVWGGTFHAMANRLLRNHASSLGLDPSFTVLDQADAADLVGAVRSELGLGERGSRFPKKDTIVAIYSRMVNSQEKLDHVLSRWFPWCAEHADALREVFTAYTQRKRRHHVLDYDDLLLHWRALLAAPVAGDALRAHFDHVLVDEYQDTNSLQCDILRGLCPPASLTVVGDDAQAIYGFRAATAANMTSFADHHPGAVTIVLEDNYRSTSRILDVANAVLAQSDAHVPKVLRAARGDGRRPELTVCHDESAQSSFVCERVLALREEGIDLRDQAVLFRAGHHAEHLELELARRDIPYVKFGGLKYLEAAHVKDALSLLRILENPADELAWHRVLGMLDGAGPATVRRVCDEIGVAQEGSSPLRTFLDRTPRVPESARADLAELCAALDERATATDGPAVDLDRLSGFCGQVFVRRYVDAEARLADLAQLAAAAAATSSRSRFLAELTLDPPDRSTDLAGPPHLDDDWLTLSTIHSAKGGEWRAVHVIHATDGNIPSDMALTDRDGLEEERRQLYVALTRARDELSVSLPQRYHVRRHGTDDRHVLAPLSRFLEPLRHHFDERAPGGSTDGRDGPGEVLLHGTVTLTDEVDASLAALWS
jgi:DNA helicase-2/ATP-dependent DNA helicase PcrA